jgi:hypothetical protein
MVNNMFENRRWLVIPTSIIEQINFDEVLQTSSDNLRISVDGLSTFVKYDVIVVNESYTIEYINAETGEPGLTTVEPGVYGRPSFYSDEYQEYTHSEILELLNTSEWTTPIENEL